MKWNRWLGLTLILIFTIAWLVSVWPVTLKTESIAFTTPNGTSGTLQLSQPELYRVGLGNVIKLAIHFKGEEAGAQQMAIFSKLEIGNIAVSPRGEGSVSIDPSKPVNLSWVITPINLDETNGTLWVFYGVSKPGRDLLLAYPISIEKLSLFGFSYILLRVISIAGIIFGFIVFLLKLNRKSAP